MNRRFKRLWETGCSGFLADILAEAEAAAEESLLIARRQEARMLELRSLLTLCRIRNEQGNVLERKMLAEVYRTFSEGLDIPDLQAARRILEESQMR